MCWVSVWLRFLSFHPSSICFAFSLLKKASFAVFALISPVFGAMFVCVCVFCVSMFGHIFCCCFAYDSVSCVDIVRFCFTVSKLLYTVNTFTSNLNKIKRHRSSSYTHHEHCGTPMYVRVCWIPHNIGPVHETRLSLSIRCDNMGDRKIVRRSQHLHAFGFGSVLFTQMDVLTIGAYFTHKRLCALKAWERDVNKRKLFVYTMLKRIKDVSNHCSVNQYTENTINNNKRWNEKQNQAIANRIERTNDVSTKQRVCYMFGGSFLDQLCTL